MQKYKITWIGEKKDITTKFGVKQKFSIKVDGNENFLGVWASQATNDWKKGDEIEGTISQSAGRDGKIFYNFELPKKNDIALEIVKRLEITVDVLKRRIERLEIEKANKPEYNTTSAGTKVPDFSEVDSPEPEVNVDDIPF